MEKKILLIGYGYWGKIWFNTFKNSGYHCAGIVDPNVFVTEVDGVIVYGDINQVSKNKFTHVIIATPPSTHLDIYRKLKQMGIQDNKILIEKPVGMSLEEAEEMNNYTNTIPGFMRDTELQFLHNVASNCNSILEIGSYKGRSTHALLSSCKGNVTVIDGWDLDVAIHSKGTVNIDVGNSIFQQFIKNVGHFKNLTTILRMSSIEAKLILKDIKFDMIFIDADHEYEGINTDLNLWLDNTAHIICGHDYGHRNYPGIKKAVDERFQIDGTVDFIWYKYI